MLYISVSRVADGVKRRQVCSWGKLNNRHEKSYSAPVFNARDLVRNPVAVSREPLGIDADLRAHQQPNEQTSKGSRYQPSPALFVDPQAGGCIVAPVEQDG